jgi:hypothetical protein
MSLDFDNWQSMRKGVLKNIASTMTNTEWPCAGIKSKRRLNALIQATPEAVAAFKRSGHSMVHSIDVLRQANTVKRLAEGLAREGQTRPRLSTQYALSREQFEIPRKYLWL